MLEAVAFIDERREMVEESEMGWRSRDLIFCFNTESQRDRDTEVCFVG